ncbi:MAG TPA: DUF928 domain-containing protein [Coleofasciculaceae cyanobacterium]
MVWFKHSSRFTKRVILLIVAVCLGLVLNVPTLVQAQLNPRSLSNRLPNQWENLFTPPPSTGNPTPVSTLGGASRNREQFSIPSGSPGAPVNTQGGATRGEPEECIPGNNSLIALVPPSGIGTTVAEYPTISWYVPQTRATSIKFVLRDANNQNIYSAEYPLAKSLDAVTNTVVTPPGIKSLTLPPLANFSPLKIGQKYSWQLTLTCDSTNQNDDILINGGIERVSIDPTLAQRLQSATQKQRVILYSDARLWYETLNTLMELKRDRPNDPEIAEAWAKLLGSVGLQAIAQEPLF